MNLQFVYTGSIGLGNVVGKLYRNDLINDIVNIEVPPLSQKEATMLISRLVLGLKKETTAFVINEGIVEYVIKKDSWLILYYLKGMVVYFGRN